MKRGAAIAAFALAALPASAASAADVCVFEGVRVAVADAGDASYVEISARLASSGSDPVTCTVDWSRVVLASPGGADATPTIAIASTFVDHAQQKPLLVADGVAPASPRTWSGPVTKGVVSVRFLVEGTASGLRVEIPRAVFPKAAHAGARAERRAKSPRDATGKFGPLGEIAVPPSPPGAAGGVGPTGPFGPEPIVAEVVPTGAAPIEPLPPSVLTLNALRDTLPRRVLELSPEHQEGWDEVARRAYAAALHGDPLVASLGVHTLAWLASGLDLQAVRLAKVAAPPAVAAAPASVVDAIGDVEARLDKRHGTTGRFLPLGRSAVFRKALTARPWDDPARAKAAREAVARLASVAPQDLSPYLVPAIVDGGAAPVDPPAPDPAIVAKPLVAAADGADTAAPAVEPRRAPSKRRASRAARRVGVGFGILVLLAGVGWFLREDGPRRPG